MIITPHLELIESGKRGLPLGPSHDTTASRSAPAVGVRCCFRCAKGSTLTCRVWLENRAADRPVTQLFAAIVGCSISRFGERT